MALAGRKQESDWHRLYKVSANRPPWDTLTKALALFDCEQFRKARFAIDLGCGAGRDTLELLRRGWRVLAVDKEPEAIRLTHAAVPRRYRSRLTTRLTSFEKVRLPKCELVNASYSLPFCPSEYFDDLWDSVVASIHSGGRFSGHFFGIHDEWAKTTPLVFHSSRQVKALLRNFKLEYFLEKEWQGRTASQSKYWHVFSVVARKT